MLLQHCVLARSSVPPSIFRSHSTLRLLRRALLLPAAFFRRCTGAAPMQILAAVVGTVTGLGVWVFRGSALFLLGAIFLVSVIPVTLIVIKPINDVILDPARELDTSDTEELLRRRGARHCWRSAGSGESFFFAFSHHACRPLIRGVG